MTERDDPKKNLDDDAYVIEDSGETLESFDLEAEERSAQPAEEATGIAPVAESAQVEELRRENKELRDRLLRSRADIDNFRKRTEREKQDFYRYALADIMRELLPVLDNFERALAASAQSAQDILVGVDLIYKQLSDVLGKAGLRPVDEEGVPFDPSIHEAVARDEESPLPAHSVATILQKGYMLNERLVRPAMVRVSTGSAAPETASSAEDNDGEAES
ncbi:MAG: nucleotide exchange factor GrpE [Acidobacteria bacterium]|nr:nucleotide exchange factor GrpE [Acidobacteriota bacterium]